MEETEVMLARHEQRIKTLEREMVEMKTVQAEDAWNVLDEQKSVCYIILEQTFTYLEVASCISH